MRTALGVTGITFYGVLLMAGGQDVLARVFDVSLNGLTWALRAAAVAAPSIAFWLTRRACLALQNHDRERLLEGDESGHITQSVEGTYREDHYPVADTERYTLMCRDLSRPLPPCG